MDLTTDEQVQAELDKLVDLGALEYVLPTTPLGERWVLGIPGSQLANLDGDQTRAFLLGCGVVTTVVARRFRQEGENEVLVRGLTLEQAQAHCQRDDTHGDGWFDGYDEDDGL